MTLTTSSKKKKITFHKDNLTHKETNRYGSAHVVRTVGDKSEYRASAEGHLY